MNNTHIIQKSTDTKSQSQSQQPNTYFILGHGSEDPLKYTSRAKVPKGITLVIPSPPYESITSANVIEFLKLNKEKRYMLKNPKKYKKGIESYLKNYDKITDETLKLRFYDEGNLIPNITIKLISNFIAENQNGKKVAIYSKSGVYENTVPNFKDLDSDSTNNKMQNEMQKQIYNSLKHKDTLFTGYDTNDPLLYEKLREYYRFSTSLNPQYLNPKLYQEIYEEAVFTPDDIDNYILENDIDTDDTFTIKLSELLKIMEKKGMKGIVYCLTCRGHLLTEFKDIIIPIIKLVLDFNSKLNKESYILYLKSIKTKQPLTESIPDPILTVFQLFHEIVDNEKILSNLNNLSKQEKIEVLDKFITILHIIQTTRYEIESVKELIKKLNDYKAYITDIRGYEKSHSNEVQKKKQERYEKAHKVSTSSPAPTTSQSSKGLNQLFKTT